MITDIFVLECSGIRQKLSKLHTQRQQRKNRQYNCHKKMHKRPNNDIQDITQKTKDRATRTPQKTVGCGTRSSLHLLLFSSQIMIQRRFLVGLVLLNLKFLLQYFVDDCLSIVFWTLQYNHIGGVIIRMLASCVVGQGLKSRWGETKD